MTYTTADAERVISQDMTEVHAHFERLAAEQRPTVRHAITQLTGTPPAENTTEPDLDNDSDEADAELDHDEQHPDGE